MTDPTIIVTGLGRCGSSLVMQMLAAGGVETVGSYPDFEDDINMRLPSEDAQREFLERSRGRAVKLLDPHLHQPPAGLEYRVIFLSRHPVEQAKSMLKLAGASDNRRSRRAMESSVRSDTVRAREAVTRIGAGRFYNLPFENIIHDPDGVAKWIVGYLLRGHRAPLDVAAMARCVRRRPATCLPYMLELELLSHV